MIWIFKKLGMKIENSLVIGELKGINWFWNTLFRDGSFTLRIKFKFPMFPCLMMVFAE